MPNTLTARRKTIEIDGNPFTVRELTASEVEKIDTDAKNDIERMLDLAKAGTINEDGSPVLADRNAARAMPFRAVRALAEATVEVSELTQDDHDPKPGTPAAAAS